MQVSDNFGPIYQTVILDGNGDGAVSFQATGSNVRLTNIFFRVSTQTAQSVCTIYKGQIADGNRVFNSNSGSTGASATGNVDLFDGETCYVVWTGGDAGSTATATFTGGKISFNEIQPSSLISQEPIAAGDGSLIFPALKSPDYVPGVSGWKLDRAGDAEINDLTARGTVFVSGSDGGHVEISNTGGFASIDLLPGPFVSGEIPGSIYAQNSIGVELLPIMAIDSPRASAGTSPASILLIGESSLGSVEPEIQLLAPTVQIGYANGEVSIPGNFSRYNATMSFPVQSIPNGGASGTLISGNVLLDSYGMVSGGGFAILRDGMYDVVITTQFAAQAVSVGFRQHYIFLNGVEAIQKRENVATNYNNAPVTLTTVYPMSLVAGDYIDFRCYQTSGAALNITAASRASINLREG